MWNLLVIPLLLVPADGRAIDATRSEQVALERTVDSRVAEEEADWWLVKARLRGAVSERLWRPGAPGVVADRIGLTGIGPDGDVFGRQDEAPKRHVLVEISYEPSAEAASQALQLRRVAVSVGLPRRLDGVADEAYLWEKADRFGYSTLALRKDSSLVLISAPSADLAKQFALHVSDGIDRYREKSR